MTTQEAYDKMRAWFTKPGAQLAKDERGLCCYRLNGRRNAKVRCAAGCLIPDRLYDREFEGHDTDVLYDDPDLASIFGCVDREFLQQAQETHDGAKTVAEFLSQLDEDAAAFGLEVAA